MNFATIHARVCRFAQYAVWIGGIALLAASVMITVDVFCRKFLSVNLTGVTEISCYLFAIATTWAYPFVLLQRANVRIDTLYTHLPEKVTAVLDVLSILLFAAFSVVLSYYSIGVLTASWSANSKAISTLGTPLWIPQTFWVMGLLLFTVTLMFLAIYAVRVLVAGNWPVLLQIVGIPSLDKEIERDIHI